MEIILIRHGKPTSADNPILKANEYALWIRRYNFSNVSANSRPQNTQYKDYFSLSSDLKRAIHSTIIYSNKSPEIIDELYREMDIPRYKLPFKIKAWSWVYLSRLLWLFGFKGPFESFKQAKVRAELAADKLIEIAHRQGKIVLFGHGVMNLFIRKALVKKGWTLHSKNNAYWGVSTLECESLGH